MRLAGRTLVLVVVGAVCAWAAHASAAPAPTSFKLTITGTAHQVWTYTAAPVTDGACTRTVTSEGIRSASFRTNSPILVRISGGRVLPAAVRNIRGTVTLGGANTIETHCGSGGNTQTSDCAQTRRTFAGATTGTRSPKRGYLSVNPIANVELARADCPVEPAGVQRRPLGPAPKLLRMPKEVLRERKLVLITLRTSPSQQVTFGFPEKGRLEETSEWRFTFVRVRG